MFIKDIFSSVKPVISFEIFPPKKDSPIETVFKTIEDLAHLHPDYMSVTYGAAGSSKGNTAEIAGVIKNIHSIESLAHLTCITSTKDEIDKILLDLSKNNISNIMALRGDVPQDMSSPLYPHFRFAKDLVSYIKKNYDFCVGGACYPEGHPECKDINKCTEYLNEKVSSGLDFLVTQLFLDNDYFYNFFDITQKLGINIPITAGIMPIINGKQIERIVPLCGSNIPPKVRRILDKYQDNPEALTQAGIAYSIEQIIELLSWGVDGIHIYTMNKPEIAISIMDNLSHIRKALNK